MADKVVIGPYGMVPLALLQQENLTQNDFRAFVALSSFQGTQSYAFPGIDKIAGRANLNERATIRAISSLVRKGWVRRQRRNIGQTNIYVVLWDVAVMTDNDTTVMPLNDTTLKRTSEKRTQEEKKAFGPFVRLTNREREELDKKYGLDIVDDCIERMNLYIGQSGMKYRSHYFAVMNWLRREGRKPRTAPKTCKNGHELIVGLTYCPTCGVDND